MLTQARIAQSCWFTAVDHIGGELGGERALKRVSPQAVPEHLLKNALVVTGEEYVGAPSLQ